MRRTTVLPIKQPNNRTCGPVSLKVVLRILGQDKSLSSLISLCKTNSYGTSTNHMIEAIEKLHLDVVSLKKATLRHIKHFLKRNTSCAIVVSYLYDLDKEGNPNPESGHWAVVRTFDKKRNRIELLDSVSGKRKSYKWENFLRRWLGYDLKRYCFGGSRKKHFRLFKRWQSRHMLVVSNPS